MDDSRGNEARPALFRVAIQCLLALLKNLLTLRYHKAAPTLDCTSPVNHGFVCLQHALRGDRSDVRGKGRHTSLDETRTQLSHTEFEALGSKRAKRGTDKDKHQLHGLLLKSARQN